MVIRQDLDDPAIGDGAVAATFQHARQLAPQRAEAAYPFIDLREPRPDEVVEVGAGGVCVPAEAEEFAERRHGKPHLARVGDEAEPVEGASANALPGAVPEAVKEERYARLMALTARISAAKLQAKVGRTLEVIVDEVGEDGATGRSQADAPDIDGQVFLRDAGHLSQGDILSVLIEDADEHDLYGVPAAK